MFEIELNLDDEEELQKFMSLHEPTRGRRLATRLGFSGKGCVAASNALMNYAANKRAAINCRKEGKIYAALIYEEICDTIYKDDIQPTIKCW